MQPLVISAVYSDTLHSKSTHYHDRHQILYVQSGEIALHISGKHYIATSGSVVIISRFEQHSIEIRSAEYRRYALFITPTPDEAETSTLQYLLSVLVNRPASFTHVLDLNEQRAELETLFSSICREKRREQPLDDYMLNLLFQQILVLLYRRQPSLFSSLPEQACGIVESVKAAFETAYGRAYTLRSVAEQYHISPSYLSHIFKQATGCSVMGYLLSCRLAAAKRLLAKTDRSIGDIVEECGFSDCSNFSRTFRAHTGVSPSDFRRQYAKG